MGIKFEDIVYEKFRCSLAHGDELPDGYGISLKVAESSFRDRSADRVFSLSDFV